MEIDLRWLASLPASGLHAADALRRGRCLAETPLASAIAGPAERLIEEVRQAALPEERLWEHLVALSAEADDSRRLAEIVLQKTVGHGPRASAPLATIAGPLAALQSAVRRAMPDLLEQVAAWVQPLMDRWNLLGTGLLDTMTQYAEPGLMVAHAGIVVLYPALGGGGCAHLWYNTARIEAVPEEPVPDVPEVVRLAWLVSQLHTDLPVYSETIPRDRLPALAAAAMLPVALAAAQEFRLIAPGPLPIIRALGAWAPAAPQGIDLAEVIRAWWETYLETRPAWNVALGALNGMLYAGELQACR